jgi:CRISPR-associated protein Csb1
MTDIKTLKENLKDENRLLLEADLEPVQSYRFQPTGFPDLGAAQYQAPDGTNMLLVESPQSMANRMELVCWDEAKKDLVEPLKGLPYILVKLDDKGSTTTSIEEAHRINSEYIAEIPNFKKMLEEELKIEKNKPINYPLLYKTLLKYDPNTLIHGVFLEELDGRIKLARSLSGFIEASGVKSVQSGGVKFSHVQPALAGGGGNVPYARTEYTAQNIKAYFNLDLSSIRSLGLDNDAESLLIILSLYKINKFLAEGLKLRTACDLKLKEGIRDEIEYGISSNIDGFTLPSLEDLETGIKELIGKCTTKGLFANPPISELVYVEPVKSKGKKGSGKGDKNTEGEEGLEGEGEV